ncbi:MAG: sulfite exporter TauE/SafE family protein [Duodenibacillus sp.]|nr:sulfite exporter TauE/SafE family protein [Duodenibacillus sp.]
MLQDVLWHLMPAGCVFIAAFLQSITGFGLVIIAAPLLMHFYEPKAVVLMMALLAFSSNAWQSLFVWKDADRPTVLWLLAGTAAAQPAGYLFFDAVSQDGLKLFAGVMLLASLLAMQLLRLRFAVRPRNSLICGAASGLMQVTTGMGGPPLILYSAYTDFTPRRLRGTCILFFLASNVCSIATYLAGGQDMLAAAREAAWLLPGIFLGVACGQGLIDAVPVKLFKRVIFWLLAGMCLMMIAQASERLF